MPNIFFIGDTHFGHDLIRLAYPEVRPGANIHEHDEALIDRWNSVVRPEDTVWHLGDFALKSQGSRMRAVASRLNGIKHLVLGNHDNFAKMNYTDFFICYGAYKFQREYLLTHIPVAPQQFYRFTANIHGHMHAQSMDDPRYWNVSCEQINCTPIEWSELKAKHAQT